MPRAVTRAVSSSFAVASSHSRGGSLDIPSSNSSSARDMFPSPRPSKMSSSSSSSRPKASSSSPSTRRHKRALSIDEPHTPPPTRPAKEKKMRQKRPAAAADHEDCLREGEALRGKIAKMPERQVSTFLANYDLEAEDRLRRAKQALQVSIESARAQMIASIYAYPRNVLSMRIEDYLCPPLLPLDPTSSSTKDKKSNITKRQSGQQGMAAPIVPPTTNSDSHRAPRKARSGEIVYSARGSPILLHRRSKGAPQKPDQILDEEEDEEDEEPFFDTASDNSISSESFSLPDEAAYTAQVMEQERNRILSSEGYFPRSSSIFHRTSSSS